MLKKEKGKLQCFLIKSAESARTGMLPRECVKEPCPLGLREGDPHAGHQRAMKDHRPNLFNTF